MNLIKVMVEVAGVKADVSVNADTKSMGSTSKKALEGARKAVNSAASKVAEKTSK